MNLLTFVENVWDKTPKKLTPEKLEELLNSPVTSKNLKKYHETGDEQYKKPLPAVIFNGLMSEEKLKIKSTRVDSNYLPSPWLGLDIDLKNQAEVLFEQVKGRVQREMACSFEEVMPMIYKTASGGLRVVVRRTPGLTLEQDRKKWEQILSLPCDAVCTNPSRLYFLPTMEEVFHLDKDMLFNLEGHHPEDYPAEAAEAPTPGAEVAEDVTSGSCAEPSILYKNLSKTDLMAVTKQLESLLCGGPAQKGGRNEVVFDTARYMSYLTEDVQFLIDIIPTYGLSSAEHARTISSAMHYKKYGFTPVILQRAIDQALKKDEAETETGRSELSPPELPKYLPDAMNALLSGTPEKSRPAVAMAVFSALRIHLYKVEFQYIDNSALEPCFLNLCIAEQASGKSVLRKPTRAILHDIELQDNKNRDADAAWREQCSMLSPNQAMPKKPNDPILLVQPDMTTPALVELSRRADGHSLYTYSEELEKMFQLKSFSTIVRSAFDSEVFGQERVSSVAISDVVQLKWSFVASSTPGTAITYLKNETNNGTLTRFQLSTIIVDEDDWGEETPEYGDYGEAYRASIDPFVQLLKNTPSGLFKCEEALQWAKEEKARQISYLQKIDGKYLTPYLWRSLQTAFWKACMLFIMNGKKWSNEIAEFASWSVSYDLWVKIHYFNATIQMNNSKGVMLQNHPKALLPLFDDTFTREDAIKIRKSVGKTVAANDVKNMLNTWIFRDEIYKDEATGKYHKTEKGKKV